MSGAIRDTYVAALQHELVELDGEEVFVGVVRQPTGWFHATVDENYPELGPPEALLDETKQRTEDLKMQGMCEEGAHNAAWEETDFADRYRAYLDESEAAQEAVGELLDRIRSGETVVLVCFEADDKRCHRTILRKHLSDRLDDHD